MRLQIPTAILFLVALTGTASCSSEPSGATDASSSSSTGAGGAGGGGGGGGSGGESAATCSEKTPVACSDEAILGLNLQSDIAPGKIENEPDGAGFLTTADARAGGAFSSDPDSYVYGRFTDNGLEKVAISDEDSLDSMDWDIAFRRYVIRINSGDSGPSCVSAARVPGMVVYDDFKVEPDTLMFRSDDYFTESCELIPDGSGLENSPATALSSYWSYPGCVKMTGHVYVVALRDGRHVKLSVLSYYSEEAQKECDTKDMTSSAGAAIFRVRWAFLQ